MLNLLRNELYVSMKNRADLCAKTLHRNLIASLQSFLPSPLENQVGLLPLTSKFITKKQVTNW